MNRIASAAPLVLLCVPLAAQRSERAVADDLAFARELAIRYQYVDLSEAVLAGLEKESLTAKQKENLALVHCQVYSEGARREGDAVKRLALFDKAATAFRSFFTEQPFSELRTEAERSYLQLVNNYARALEMALDEAVGEEAARMRESIKTLLEDGLERTAELKAAFSRPDLSQAEKFERWRIMLDRATMLTTLGNSSDDPEFLFSQAEKELDTVMSEAGDTSGTGLNASLALAKLHLARGNNEDAVAFAEYVVTIAVPENPELEEWKELAFEAKAERFKLIELAMPTLLQANLAKGSVPAACKWALYFYNSWKREGFTISPLGNLALLSAAATLLDAGGYVGGGLNQGNLRWFETEDELQKAGFSGRDARSALDLALKTAQDVNTENRGTTLQPRAQKLISNVISRPGVIVAPDVLFEAAQGNYNNQEFEAAVRAFKGLMGALDGRDDATRQDFMPKVLFFLGQCYSKLNRPLEAAMAFREAATTWKGDPEYQQRVAQGYMQRISEVRKSAGGDKLIEERFLEAEKVLQEVGNDSGVAWRQAERKYDAKDYDGARTSYLALTASADEHEKAIAKAALCLYKKNDKDGAAKEFRHYLEVFVPDAANAVTGLRKQSARTEARAQATYYLGLMANEAQKFDEVLSWYKDYDTKFPEQGDYVPRALSMSIEAALAKYDVATAKRLSATLQQKFASNLYTGRSALKIFSALKAEEDKKTKAGDKDGALALKRDMVEYMRVSNATASEANFGNLRIESSLFLELGDFVRAEEALRATLKAFEGKSDRAGDLEKFVMPDLGEALLGQKRVPEAFAVLDPLMPKDESAPQKPSSVVIRDWCKAVTGWMEGDGTQNVEVPGAGGDLKRVTEQLNKLIEGEKAKNDEGRGAWTCPWYELKFELAFAYLVWSRTDATQKGSAKRIVDDLASQLGDPDMKDVAKNCGNDVLRKRFLWLRNQVR